MSANNPSSLLLLPGLWCDQTIWAPQLGDLSEFAPQVADYGDAHSLAEMATRALASAPSRFALAGHSMGARVALEVVRRMGDTYPELRDKREFIARATEDEEVRFRSTLKRGMKILDERFAEMRSSDERTLPAGAAADLYTTYGFPLDLTQVICAESNFDVDVPGERLVSGVRMQQDGDPFPDLLDGGGGELGVLGRGVEVLVELELEVPLGLLEGRQGDE